MISVSIESIRNDIHEHFDDPEYLDKISDQVAKLMVYCAYSTDCKKLAKLGHILKTDSLVDEMISITQNEEASYRAIYATKMITNIKTPYALEQACSHELSWKHIQPLYQHYSDHPTAISSIRKMVEDQVSTGAAWVQPIDMLKSYLKFHLDDDQLVPGTWDKTIPYLIFLFNRCVMEAYPTSHCQWILEWLHPYRDRPSVQEVFDKALNSTIQLRNVVKKLDLEIDSQLFNKHITERIIQELIQQDQYGGICCMISQKYDPLNRKLKMDDLKVILDFLESRLESLFTAIQNQLPHEKHEFIGSEKIEAFVKNNFQDYYSPLICLGLVTRYTSSKDIYNQIKNFLSSTLNRDNSSEYFKGDAYTLPNIMNDVNANSEFGINQKKENEIYYRFSRHYTDFHWPIFYQTRAQILLELVQQSERKESEYCKLLICDLVESDYHWMPRLYMSKYGSEMKEIAQSV